jgi:hypothetical protein
MVRYPMFSSESSQSPSPSPVFSHLCELCVSAFSSLVFGFHPERSDPRLRPCGRGSASPCPGASPRNVRSATPLRPKHFLSFPQRVNIQHAATPATPFLSCVYFTILWIPGVGGHMHPNRITTRRHRLYPSFVFILLRTLLHHAKHYPLSVQCFPHSFAETPGVGWGRHRPQSVRFLVFTTHYPLLTLCSSETNSAQQAGNRQWLPTRDTARAAVRALSLWSVSRC